MIENEKEHQSPAASDEKASPPSCFGDPAKVCPRDAGGIMQPQVSCLSCQHLKSCLRTALRQQGVIAPSVLEAPAVSKVTGFFKRWSDQKLTPRNTTKKPPSK